MKVSYNAKIMSVFCDKNSKLRYNKLLDYMLEASIIQEKILKEKLDNLNEFWVIYQWDIDIQKLPEKFDNVKVQTYYTFSKKFYAFRNYDVIQDDRVIVRAKTKWLLINKEKKIPMRITDELSDIYEKEDGYDYIQQDVEELEGDYEKIGEYTVRKTDIDLNLHANNARYVEWIENFIEDCIIKKIEIMYKKELKLGEKVEIYRLVHKSNIYFKLIKDNEIKTIIKITQ